MASKLEESTKIVTKLGIGCGVIILAIVGYHLGAKILRGPTSPFNPYPQFAENKFGGIPKPEFESLQLTEESYPEFKLETVDGQLPRIKIPDSFATVYKTKTPRQSLIAQDTAVKMARSIGFSSRPRSISSTESQWGTDTKSLIINKLYGVVKLTTDYTRDTEAMKTRDISPDSEHYITMARNYLDSADLFPDEYKESEKSTITYLKLNKDSVFEKAKSVQDADFIRVDFFKDIELVEVTIPEDLDTNQQKEIESYRIYTTMLTDNPHEGLLYVIFGGTGNTKDLYELRYIDWEIVENSTYELLPIKDAWDKIKQDKIYLRSVFKMNESPYAKFTPPNVKEFLLTNADIVYYSSKDYLQYLQPIYKFNGIAILADGVHTDFTFYYPAVKS